MKQIYCDSNIFRLIKSTHPYYNVELHTAMETLKTNNIFVFSDAHLDDLKESTHQHRENDLLFMEHFVGDQFYTYNLIGKRELKIQCLTPKEAYAAKDYEAAAESLKNPFDLEEAFKNLPHIPGMEEILETLKAFTRLPLSSLSGAVELSDMDEKQRKQTEAILPGYHSEMTIQDMMKNITPFSIGMLEDKKKVTEARGYIREDLDRELYAFEKYGLEFNERFKETPFKKTFVEFVDDLLTDSERAEMYTRFLKLYNMLEFYNVTQERTGSGGLKKFDLDSLNTDALHAYYASFSDFLVTDDRGVQEKAKIVYYLMGIPTEVLSIKEFIDFEKCEIFN